MDAIVATLLPGRSVGLGMMLLLYCQEMRTPGVEPGPLAGQDPKS